MDNLVLKKDITVRFTLKGAMITSLVKDGVEYLWQGNPEFWAGQAPVCFPINGVLVDNEAVAFGKKCCMKRHGVARISPFTVKEKGDDFITFIQLSDDSTRQMFPFDYKLEIKYTLVGSTIKTEYIVTNTGDGKLPFVVGGHPAFNCPLGDDEFEDYSVTFSSPVDIKPLRPDHHTGLVDVNERFDVLKDNVLHIKHDLFYDDALIFDNIKAKSAILMGKFGRGVRVDYPLMNNLLVWSAENDAPFVALEPWSGISNCSDENNVFENKRGMSILLPNESKTLGFDITLI